MTYPTNQIPSINPQNFAIATPIGLQSAPRDPNAQDNTFVPGSEWQNSVTKVFWKCVSSTVAGAVWIAFVPSTAGSVSTLTGNSGGAVGPDGMGNINVVGDNSKGINIVGTPGSNILTASLVGGGIATQSYTTNLNTPVTPTSSGVIDLTQSTSTYTDGAVAHAIKIELQGTNHALFIGRSAHVPATTIPVGTNGQVVIGATAADPAFGTITSGDGSITFITGANTLDMRVNGSAFAQTITGNTGGALSPSAGNWNIVGGTGISTAGSGSTLTINANGAGFSWAAITASQALVAEHGYICVSPGGALSLALPGTANVGDAIKVVLDGATSWQITQAAGQQIRVGSLTTTSGAGGSVKSTAQGDSIEIVCRAVGVAPASTWTTLNFIGNLSVT